MDTYKSYFDLEVWKQSRVLVNDIYKLTKEFPKEEIYELISQIRRSAISIPSNIAEGCGRQTTKDTIQFLFIARGSLYEVETQLFLAFDQQYIHDSLLEELLKKTEDLKKLINGLINYYKKL